MQIVLLSWTLLQLLVFQHIFPGSVLPLLDFVLCFPHLQMSPLGPVLQLGPLTSHPQH